MAKMVTKRFRVLKKSFVNTSIANPGDVVTMSVPEGFKPGDNLVEVIEQAPSVERLIPSVNPPQEPHVTTPWKPVEEPKSAATPVEEVKPAAKPVTSAPPVEPVTIPALVHKPADKPLDLPKDEDKKS